MATKPKIDPCWANQKPSLKPPIWMVFNCSTNKIPQPKDTINQRLSSMVMKRMFFFQYVFFIMDILNYLYNRFTTYPKLKIMISHIIRIYSKLKIYSTLLGTPAKFPMTTSSNTTFLVLSREIGFLDFLMEMFDK